MSSRRFRRTYLTLTSTTNTSAATTSRPVESIASLDRVGYFQWLAPRPHSMASHGPKRRNRRRSETCEAHYRAACYHLVIADDRCWIVVDQELVVACFHTQIEIIASLADRGRERTRSLDGTVRTPPGMKPENAASGRSPVILGTLYRLTANVTAAVVPGLACTFA